MGSGFDTRMTIDSSGNVGIGTTSPAAELHVNNSSGAAFTRISGTTAAVLDMYGGATNTKPIRFFGGSDTEAYAGIRALANNSGLSFETGVGGSTAASERMRITSSGNVGIGTSSPGEKLDVSGNIRALGANSRVMFGPNGFEAGIKYASDATLQIASRTGENIAFTNGNDGAERMRIDSSGSLLVGTTSNPDNRFDLATNPSAGRGAEVGRISMGRQGSGYPHIGYNAGPTGTNGFVNKYIADTSSWIHFNNASIIFNRDTGTTAAGAIAGTESMRIDSGGNVGIGTPSPSSLLDVSSGTNTDGTDVTITVGGTSANTRQSLITKKIQSSDRALEFYAASGSSSENIRFFRDNTNETMRIDSSGNLLVGTTDNTPYNNGTSTSADKGICLGNGFISTANYNASAADFNRTGTDGNIVNFYKNGATKGNISITSSAVAYNTTSDERLKENIVDAPAGNIDAIRVRSFDWKADGTHQTYGMVAQELVDVAPEAVSQGATDNDMWGVDYSKLVPMMIKEIQDLKAKVKELESR